MLQSVVDPLVLGSARKPVNCKTSLKTLECKIDTTCIFAKRLYFIYNKLWHIWPHLPTRDEFYTILSTRIEEIGVLVDKRLQDAAPSPTWIKHPGGDSVT